MGSIDEVTWQVLTVVLTVIGLVASGLLWRLRGPASGIRGVGWSLLPVAALLTGTWRLIWQIGDAVVSWAVRFVFSPLVWLGVAVAGVSVVLLVTGSAMRTRGIGSRDRAGRKHTTGLTQGSAAASSDKAPTPRDTRPAPTGTVDDDLADIEAILKRRGIT